MNENYELLLESIETALDKLKSCLDDDNIGAAKKQQDLLVELARQMKFVYPVEMFNKIIESKVTLAAEWYWARFHEVQEKNLRSAWEHWGKALVAIKKLPEGYSKKENYKIWTEMHEYRVLRDLIEKLHSGWVFVSNVYKNRSASKADLITAYNMAVVGAEENIGLPTDLQEYPNFNDVASLLNEIDKWPIKELNDRLRASDTMSEHALEKAIYDSRMSEANSEYEHAVFHMDPVTLQKAVTKVESVANNYPEGSDSKTQAEKTRNTYLKVMRELQAYHTLAQEMTALLQNKGDMPGALEKVDKIIKVIGKDQLEKSIDKYNILNIQKILNAHQQTYNIINQMKDSDPEFVIPQYKRLENAFPSPVNSFFKAKRKRFEIDELLNESSYENLKKTAEEFKSCAPEERISEILAQSWLNYTDARKKYVKSSVLPSLEQSKEDDRLMETKGIVEGALALYMKTITINADNKTATSDFCEDEKLREDWIKLNERKTDIDVAEEESNRLIKDGQNKLAKAKNESDLNKAEEAFNSALKWNIKRKLCDVGVKLCKNLKKYNERLAQADSGDAEEPTRKQLKKWKDYLFLWEGKIAQTKLIELIPLRRGRDSLSDEALEEEAARKQLKPYLESCGIFKSTKEKVNQLYKKKQRGYLFKLWVPIGVLILLAIITASNYWGPQKGWVVGRSPSSPSVSAASPVAPAEVSRLTSYSPGKSTSFVSTNAGIVTFIDERGRPVYQMPQSLSERYLQKPTVFGMYLSQKKDDKYSPVRFDTNRLLGIDPESKKVLEGDGFLADSAGNVRLYKEDWDFVDLPKVLSAEFLKNPDQFKYYEKLIPDKLYWVVRFNNNVYLGIDQQTGEIAKGEGYIATKSGKVRLYKSDGGTGPDLELPVAKIFLEDPKKFGQFYSHYDNENEKYVRFDTRWFLRYFKKTGESSQGIE